MATPLNPLNSAPDIIPPVAAPASQKVCCEFCECQLTPHGEIVRMGERAKKFRKHEEEIEKLNAMISSQQSEISQLNARLAEQSPAPDASRRRSGVVVSSS
jgi:uncharacterized protein (DUF305 family)